MIGKLQLVPGHPAGNWSNWDSSPRLWKLKPSAPSKHCLTLQINLSGSYCGIWLEKVFGGKEDVGQREEFSRWRLINCEWLTHSFTRQFHSFTEQYHLLCDTTRKPKYRRIILLFGRDLRAFSSPCLHGWTAFPNLPCTPRLWSN